MQTPGVTLVNSHCLQQQLLRVCSAPKAALSHSLHLVFRQVAGKLHKAHGTHEHA